MSVNHQKLTRRIAFDLGRKRLSRLTPLELIAILQAAPQSEVRGFMESLRAGNGIKAGKILLAIVQENISAVANEDAAAILADDVIARPELQEWLGE